MEELKDEGYGITTKSLEYWNKNKDKLGTIQEVACSFDPIHVEAILGGEGGLITPLEYNLKIIGSNGVMYLSGCNCGYGGEGPNGTRRILEELGISHDKAVELIHQERFAVEIPHD